ncbi:lysylphosphatidylglycerol synthetase family protein [Pseudorhizobium endolithicum]|uniref:Lysylphosphatidylglycerol synthetase family protein n=1 Tax=Pseudorhizobium endolithicum TaxID=1191678 RepID=A0ABM8PJM4_9HYPH|nr:lysylphosphatidylglycerol synthase domain-containing protein [Pseudorhizobium endolithicum]CAD6419258.1 lysylphosphatidylglycerol synthetase family protein [Rhizobium sp. Q54]CAD7033695.1 lysylphosphatidylglycerol synthetase family protein [Pseudorhizobium endolithicum]
MTLKKYLWPVVGGATIAVCAWLLYKELRGLSLDDVWDSLSAISPFHWLLAALSTLVAYAALAGYDRIALMHLGRSVNLWFITVTSFTTYALSHNVGASVLSGGVVRYRAYSSKGLSGREIGALIAICSFTFALGTLLLAAIVLILKPHITERFGEGFPISASSATGYTILAFIALYVAASFLRLRPVTLGSTRLSYPSPKVVLSQLIIGPLELVGAAGIIYFALPDAGNPGFVVVLGIFLASFSAALISHAPGGLGVLELVFVMGLPDMDQADVIAALLVFRLFYLMIPFAIALGVIFVFERTQFRVGRDADGP